MSDDRRNQTGMGTRCDAAWKQNFIDLLHFIFNTYHLDTMVLQEDYGIPVDTFGSWQRGHALPSSVNMDVLASFVLYNVYEGPHDDDAYMFVLERLKSSADLPVYDRLVRLSTHTGEFLSLALEAFHAKARRKKPYVPAGEFIYPPSGRTRAVVLDFAGTLASDLKADSTWGKIWDYLGLEPGDFSDLHRRYSGGDSHLAYMNELVDRFKKKGLTKVDVLSAGRSCGLRAGAKEALLAMDEADIRVYIVSRSERSFIRGALGEAAMHVAEIHCNYLRYGKDGVVESVVETGFDREGKARFIRRAALDLRISPRDVLFIGNSSNDTFAYRSGARTLCVNPYNTNGDDRHVWHDCLKMCEDFTEVLGYLDYDVTTPDRRGDSRQLSE